MKTQINPPYILLFNLAVLATLALLAFAFPDKGIRVYKNEKDSMVLNFPSVESVLFPEEVDYKDISGIIAAALNDSIYCPSLTEVMVQHVMGTKKQNFRVSETYADTVSIGIENLENVKAPIQFPHNDRTVLFSFFAALRNNKNELIRVLHYGDSQLEGDRMTNFIRYNLQQQFGGGGVGCIPASPIYWGNSVKHETSGNWSRFTTMEHLNKTLIKEDKKRRFGSLMSFCRFAPIREHTTDSVSTDSAKNTIDYEAWIKISPAARSFRNNSQYGRCRIFYGYNQAPVQAELYIADNLLYSETLEPVEGMKVLEWEVNSPPEMTIKFKGEDSPDIYALSLDTKSGIAVDNIPMRGSSGTQFTSVNYAHMQEMLRELNVKLLILQFGGNVTPAIQKSYNYYGDMIYSQLMMFKRMLPDACIILIGPADMSRKVDDHFESYPNIPAIRDALRKAAFRADCGFWDMYEAMGGANSMPSWVNNGLAGSDYTHFTPKGARIISKLFYNALISEYNDYLKVISNDKK